MKSNINNPMSKTFGEEFNLSTDEVIKCIEKVHNLEVIDKDFRCEDVEVALYNDDYYVRPGESRRAFKQEWMKIYSEAKANCDEEFAYVVLIIKTVDLIKRFFDEAYFKKQIDRRSFSFGSKIKLKKYLNKFNKTQLLRFMNALVICKGEQGRFISEPACVALFKEIDVECRKEGLNVPMALDSPEGIRLLRQHPFYYFEVLSTRTISNKLCEAIDLDVPLATALAIKLYECGYEVMLNCIKDRFDIEIKPIQVKFQTDGLQALRASLLDSNPDILKVV